VEHCRFAKTAANLSPSSLANYKISVSFDNWRFINSGGGTKVQGVAQGDLTVQAMVNGKGEIAASS
jgi:hypothetical protein